MPTVLVITEQERVQRLFARMGESIRFRLRVAPSLAQGEEEIALRLPHYLFVENGISGMSGAGVMSYLRGLLPEEVEVILMAPDDSVTKEFREAGGLFCLDLSLGDEALEHAISGIVQLGAPQQKQPPVEPLPHSEKTARKLLFDLDRMDPEVKNTWFLWFIALVLAVALLSVFTYHLGRSSTPRAPQNTASVAAPAESGGTGRGPEQNPISQQITERRPPDTKSAPPQVESGSASGITSRKGQVKEQTYVVQPGDTLLKILLKDFGFTYQDAMRVIPELQRRNGFSVAKQLKPGQTLLIPAGPKPGPPAKQD